MTASRHVTLWCDISKCPEWFDDGNPRVIETRRTARLEGWRFHAQRDICPEHSRPTKEKYTWPR